VTRIFLIFELGDVDGQTNFPKKGKNREKWDAFFKVGTLVGMFLRSIPKFYPCNPLHTCPISVFIPSQRVLSVNQGLFRNFSTVFPLK
jgi:hypothetical protein